MSVKSTGRRVCHSSFYLSEGCFDADFYLAVKAALHHESLDSEEDSEGLRCYLGLGSLSTCLASISIAVLYDAALPSINVEQHELLFNNKCVLL